MKRALFVPTYPHAPIARRGLGRTGASVSEICLGTMSFGWRLNKDASFDLLDRYHRAGGNFLQAVNVDLDADAPPGCIAHPETFVGDWLAERGARRREWFLSTRLTLRRESKARISARIRRAVERSLSRLGVDDLDMLVCEWTPAFLPVDEMLETLDTLTRDGLVRHCALAGFPIWGARAALARSAELGLRRAEVLQCDYSLLRRIEAELGPARTFAYDAPGLVATSPLAGGYLANPAYAPGGLAARRMGRLGSLQDGARNRVILARVSSVARAHGVTEARVAAAWCLASPWVSSVLVGVRTPDQLDDMFAAGRLRLSAEALAELDEVSRLPIQNEMTTFAETQA